MSENKPIINRVATLEKLRAKQNKINLGINSDGECEDGGAAEFWGEVEAVVDTIQSNLPDKDILEMADDLCCTRQIVYEGNTDYTDRANFVSAYKMRQGYGGPEEGGWYYDDREFICSFPINYNEDDTSDENELIDFLQKKLDYINSGDYYSVISGTKLAIYSEKEKGQNETKGKPIYE